MLDVYELSKNGNTSIVWHEQQSLRAWGAFRIHVSINYKVYFPSYHKSNSLPQGYRT